MGGKAGNRDKGAHSEVGPEKGELKNLPPQRAISGRWWIGDFRTNKKSRKKNNWSIERILRERRGCAPKGTGGKSLGKASVLASRCKGDPNKKR